MDESGKTLTGSGTHSAAPQFLLAVDLGAGETAVAWYPRQRHEKSGGPEMLFLDGEYPAWITAYSENGDGSLGEIGWTAVSHARRNPQASFHTAFKARPDTDGIAGNHLRRYCELLLKKVAALPDRAGPWILCVGCPSGWSPGEMDKYKKELSGCHQSAVDVMVIRESRAAMHQALAQLEMRPESAEASGTLVIDVGSSTTDVTLIRGIDEIVDSGAEIGAGLLDEAILECLPEWLHGASERGAVRGAQGKHRSGLLAECRRAKERYFHHLWGGNTDQWRQPIPEVEQQAEGQSDRVTVLDDDGRAVKIGVLLEYPQMQQVLGTPIAALGGRTWPEAFRDFLLTIPERLKYEASPERIVLTGGGAKMSFVQQLVREAFPHAQVLSAGDPSCMIAKGLALAGDRLLACQTFGQTMPRVLEDHLLPTLKKLFETYLDGLAKDYASQLYEDAIKPEIQDWTTGVNASIADTEGYIKSRVRKWLASEVPKGIWERRTKKLLGDTARTWCDQPDVAAACAKFKINPKTLLSGDLGSDGSLGDLKMPATLSDPDEMIPDIDGVGSSIVASVGTALAIAIAAMKAPLLLMGPIGWAVLALVALAAKKGAEHMIRVSTIPDFARGWLLSDSKRETLRRDIEGIVARRVQPQFATALEEVRRRLESSVRSAIESIVDRERRLVGENAFADDGQRHAHNGGETSHGA
ncbi:MAG: hypothetical protein R3B68_09295 [Phycisphaerales bacterium]